MRPNEYVSSLKKMVPPKVTQELDKLVLKYENRVKEMVHQLDLKTADAKKKGKKKIESFSQEVKKTKHLLEKNLSRLLNKETEKINEKLEHLVSYLKSLSLEKEKEKAMKVVSPKATNSTKRKTTSNGTKRTKKRPSASI